MQTCVKATLIVIDGSSEAWDKGETLPLRLGHVPGKAMINPGT